MKSVIHYKAGPYLPLTENWIYTQIINHKIFLPIVYCHGLENIDYFPIKKLRAFGKSNKQSNPWTMLNKAMNRLFKYNPFIGEAMKKDKPDILHAHFGGSGYLLLKHKKDYGIPLVTSFYGVDVSKLINIRPVWKRRYKVLFEQGDLFLAEGTRMREKLIALGCPEEKAKLHRIGIDVKRIRFMERKPREDGVVCLLIAARFCPKKGIPYALEAINLLSERRKTCKLQLTIIGDSSRNKRDKYEKNLILNILNKIEGKVKIKMLGYQPYPVFIEELYKNHIFISPSITADDGDDEGGAPVSLIEASSSGMTILSTFHCDIPEIVLDGQSGYLVPEKDVDALASRLEQLITTPDLWRKMGKAGRKHVEKYHDAEKQAQQLEELYLSLL